MTGSGLLTLCLEKACEAICRGGGNCGLLSAAGIGISFPHSLLQKQRRLLKLEEQLARLRMQATDKEENKQVALGTAKLNYLDPRISIAWCVGLRPL